MPSRFIDARLALALLACALSLATAGCEGRNAHASAPAAAPAPAQAELDRPMTTAPDTDATPPLDATVAAPPPSIPAPSTPPASVAIPATKPAPAPRRPSEEQPSAEAGSQSAGPPAALQITPELSPGDAASYERKTADDLAVAEKNLGQASGKQLSAAQQDLVAKITSFASQSRDASRSGDWARAQNLAQKARLLSVELLNSL
jgi:hypothetical protein